VARWKPTELSARSSHLLALLAVAWVSSLASGGDGWVFERYTVGDTGPTDPDDILAADLDGDGDGDILVTEDPEMVWYENADGTGRAWQRHVARSDGPFMGTTVGDFDGDGDVDVASTADEQQAVWMENDGRGGVWTRHDVPVTGTIVDNMRSWDYDGDGREDLVIERYGPAPVHYCQAPSSEGSAWRCREIGVGAGLCLGDVDGDDRPDVVSGGRIFIAPKEPAEADWPVVDLAQVGDSFDKCAVGDVDGDGRTDLALSEGEGSRAVVVFGPDWARSETVWDAGETGLHTMQLADFDRDGDLDLFTAEIHDRGRTFVFENTDGRGTRWVRHEQVPGDLEGTHNAWIGDFNGDGRVDLLGKHYSGGPISIWFNSLPK
jgi:hypothetical protein